MECTMCRLPWPCWTLHVHEMLRQSGTGTGTVRVVEMVDRPCWSHALQEGMRTSLSRTYTTATTTPEKLGC